MENHYIFSTISNSEPPISKQIEFNNKLAISKELWRKCEFIESTLLPFIEEDIEKIQAIIDFYSIHEGVHRNNFGFPPTYTRQYVRNRINLANLNIPLNELSKILRIEEQGPLVLDYSYLVEDGFFLKSKNTIYYGIIKGDIIKELYVENYNAHSFEEFIFIAKQYNLVFVDWLSRFLQPSYVGQKLINRIINNIDFYIQIGGWYSIPNLVNDLKLTGISLSTDEISIIVKLYPNKYIVNGDNIRLGETLNERIKYLNKTPPDKLYFRINKWHLKRLLSTGVKDFSLELIERDKLQEIRTGWFSSLIEINVGEMCYDGFEFFYSLNHNWHTKIIPPNYLKKTIIN